MNAPRLFKTQATVFKRPVHDIENIERLFEDANTAGRLLTGWQILKAHHYGRIVAMESDDADETDKTLKALEDWRLGRRKKVFEDDVLHDGPPLRKMPLDRIAIFGLLAGERNAWWCGTPEKNAVRLRANGVSAIRES